MRHGRRFRWAGWALAVACAAGLTAPTPARAEDPSLWKFNTSYNYWTGKYGTPETTDIVYIPFTLTRLFQDGDLGLTLPYVSVKGPASETVVGNAATSNGSSSSRIVTNSGLGDVLLKGRYYLLDEGDWVPTTDMTAEVKFPTADSDNNLGTGAFDERLGLSLSKELPPPFFAVADSGYTWVGRESGLDLQNRWDYLVGLGIHITKRLSASFNYEEVEAFTPEDVNEQDVLYGVDFKATKNTTLSAYLLSGLSNSAPDFGLSLGAGILF